MRQLVWYPLIAEKSEGMDEARYDTMLPQVQYHFRRGINYNSYIITTIAIIIIMRDKSKPFTILTFDSVESDSILLKEERSVR